MKRLIVSSLILLLALLVGGVGTPVAAQAAESLVLARVEMAAAMAGTLPVYALAQDAAGKEYAVVLAPQTQVKASGATFRIFESAARASDYVIARERRAGARAKAASYAPVVYDDGRRIIARASVDEAEALAELGFEVRRLPARSADGAPTPGHITGKCARRAASATPRRVAAMASAKGASFLSRRRSPPATPARASLRFRCRCDKPHPAFAVPAEPCG